MNSNKWLNYFLFLAGLLSGLYFISLNVTGASFQFFPGDYIDGRFNNYLLEHAYRFFTGKTPEFWSAPFMFPEENVITYSDNLLGSSPFYCIFRMFGADRETAFQLWYLTITILNYACCYVLLNYLFKNAYAAVCGAMVFAFSIALQSQMGHAQTFPRFAAPLAVWLLLKYIEELKPLYFFLALLMLAYQMYCGIYLGFLLAVPFAILVLYSVYLKWEIYKNRIIQWQWLARMILAKLATILFLLPLLLPYFARARQTGFYPFANILQSIPTPGSYFFSWKGSLWWDRFSETCISYPAFWDHEIFAGGFATFGFLIVALITVIALFRKKINEFFDIGPLTKAVIVTGIVTCILFLRINEFSLYRFIYAVPGYGSMRALQRIINIELLFFAAALALLVNFMTKKKNILSLFLTLAFIAGIVADNYVSEGHIHQKEKAVSQQRINELVVKMQGIPKTSFVSYEPDSMSSAPMDYQLDAMLAAQQEGITTLNGYSATSPGGYGAYWVKPNAESRQMWLERKGKMNIPVVVVK